MSPPGRGNAPGSAPEALAKIIKLQPRQAYRRDDLDDLLGRLQAHIDAYRNDEASADAIAWAVIFTCSDLTALALTGVLA